MFLVFFSLLKDIIKCTLNFVEDHSVLVGVVTSVIVGSLWFKKFLKQKRAEAFFGFYARLSICLRTLQARLDEKGQLDVSTPEAGNIFSLIYVDSCIKEFCPRYTKPSDKELELYQNSAIELKKILLATENNVYPPGANRKEWYESQYILVSFCEFISNNEYQHTTNEKTSKGESEPKHIVKCKLLIGAIDYIQKSIECAKY